LTNRVLLLLFSKNDDGDKSLKNFYQKLKARFELGKELRKIHSVDQKAFMTARQRLIPA